VRHGVDLPRGRAPSEKCAASERETGPREEVHPDVLDAMRELGVDLNVARPQRLTQELARQAQVLITMG
jgi:arsenate reductase (thioredoxin)